MPLTLQSLHARIHVDQREADQRIPDEHRRKLWKAALDNGEDFCRKVVRLQEVVEADESLSARGKRQKLSEQVQALRAELIIAKTTEVVKGRAQQLRAELFALPPVPPGDPVIQLLREQEIRGLLRGLSVADRMRRIEAAIEHADGLTLSAALADPAAELVQREHFDRVMQDHVEKTKPHEFRALLEIENLAGHLAGLNDHAEQVLSEFGA